MKPPEYRFVPVTRADFPMLRGWLAAPHVAGIWGDTDEELALIGQEIDGGDCRMHIVHADRPFAFIQNWGAHEAGVPHMTDLPPGSRGIDTFLGDPAYLGRGHGRTYARRYASNLRGAGVLAVVTDPRLDNPRGIAMYRRAGFEARDIRTAEDGTRVLLMDFRHD